MEGFRGRPRRGTVYREVWRVQDGSKINNRRKGRQALRNKEKEETHLGHFLHSRTCQSKTAFFRLKPKSGLLTVEKGPFRLSFPTGESSRKTQSKRFHTCFCNPSHRHPTTKHTPICPHTHTKYHTAQYHTRR